MSDDPLIGLAAPRPLPSDLRERLQDALLAEVVRPVTPDVAGDLAAALLLADLEAPRPVPLSVRKAVAPRRSRVRRWGAVSVGAAAAAAAVVVVALPRSGSVAPPSAAPAPVGDPHGSLLFRDRPLSGLQTAGQFPLAYRSDALVTDGSSGAAWTGSAWTDSVWPATTSTAGKTLATARAVRSAHLITTTPAIGSVDGGTWVILTGYGFTPHVTVMFGTVPARTAIAISPTEVLAQAPPHPAGRVSVTANRSNALVFAYL